jgi:hypothetical protein
MVARIAGGPSLLIVCHIGRGPVIGRPEQHMWAGPEK